jgi:hypothetical protein
VSASLAMADGLRAEPLMSATLAKRPRKKENKLIINQSLCVLTEDVRTKMSDQEMQYNNKCDSSTLTIILLGAIRVWSSLLYL